MEKKLTIDEKAGLVLREERKAKGFTQVEFSRSVGISEWCISRFENGRQSMTLSDICVMAKVLDLTPDSLMAKIVAVKKEKPIQYKSEIVYGNTAIDIANEYASSDKARRKIKACGDGGIVTHIFNTVDERNAYLKGVEETCGWNDWDTFFYKEWDK